MEFEWDSSKDLLNQMKHGVSFAVAQRVFADPQHILATDDSHSEKEQRYYCFGKVDGEIITVRFTRRNDKIRIFGAGYWRKGKQTYEEKNR
jgi:uncharacterized DUF497 family protein